MPTARQALDGRPRCRAAGPSVGTTDTEWELFRSVGMTRTFAPSPRLFVLGILRPRIGEPHSPSAQISARSASDERSIAGYCPDVDVVTRRVWGYAC